VPVDEVEVTIDAIAALLVDHMPPVDVLLMIVETPTHIKVEPVIAGGTAVTVTAWVT
jgi:hypothetical protein